MQGEDIHVPYDKAKVKDAPRVEQDSDGHLSRDEEDDLYRYYDLGGTPRQRLRTDRHGDTSANQSDGDIDREGAGHDTSGPDTDSTR